MRKCHYCGQEKKLTREHLWSKWVRRHLPRQSTGVKHAVSYSLDSHRIEKGKLTRHGDPYSQQLKILCRECNGRLGVLQELCKPAMLPLIDGNWIDISASHMELVSKWAVMFTMNIEAAHPPTMAISQQDRSSFKDNFDIPTNWTIWVAPLSVHFGWGVFNHFGWCLFNSADRTHLDQAKIRCNSQSTAFIVGNIFILTHWTAIDEVSVVRRSFDDAFGLRRIWPNPHETQIRPFPGIDESTASAAACALAPEVMPKRQNWETF